MLLIAPVKEKSGCGRKMYGEGMIACDQFFECLTGEKFADYVREQFPQIFSKSANAIGKYFLQDGDPVQNSAAAKRAF